MTEPNSAEILDLIEPQYQDLVSRTWISLGEISQLQGNIAFYGGSFDPPHNGHQAVMEAALVSVADHLVVSVHSHNLATKSGLHAPLHDRIVMLALVLNSSALRSRIRLAAPSALDGIQNPEFDKIASSMIARGAEPWIVMGEDAVKPTYRREMRQLSHVIVERPSYDDQSKSVLMGRVVHIEPQREPIDLVVKRQPSTVAKLYDARVGGFHYVISLGEDSWPYGAGPVGILFSERIEGHNYTSFDISSYAVRDHEYDQWSLFKAPLHVEFRSGENPAWHLSNG